MIVDDRSIIRPGNSATSAEKKSATPQKLAPVATDPTQFNEVFRAEWREINRRRRRNWQTDKDARIEYAAETEALPPNNLVGLALSGGGIRSATFCLGLLQGLHRAGLLQAFDYLSTVSGGGYVGGWWSAWLAREDEGQRGRDDAFPPPEQIVPDTYSSLKSTRVGQPGETPYLETKLAAMQQGNIGQERIADLLSAGNDPVHHLRLFGNYLTPRKGALSADTWRAVTTISRNLLLTWFILLPLLIAAIIVGQLYFVLQPFSYDKFHTNFNFFFADPDVSSTEVLLARLWLVLKPLLGIVLWIVALICAWMINSGEAGTSRMRRAGWAGVAVAVVFFTMLCLILYSYANRPSLGPYLADPLFHGWLALGIWLVIYACWLPDAGDGDIRHRREVRRNRIVRVHARLLMLLVAAAFVLIFAGFGHELVNYLNSPVGIPKYVTKAGGWAAVLASIGGSIYTALKTAPSGGHDPREVSKPTLFSRIVFTVTPPLVLVVLAVLASWIVNILLSHINCRYIYPRSCNLLNEQRDASLILLLTATTCAGIVLSLFFALRETKWRCRKDEPQCRAFWLLASLLALLSLLTLWPLGNVVAIYLGGEGWLKDFTRPGLMWLVALGVSVSHVGASFFILSRLTADKERQPRLSVKWRLFITVVWISLTGIALYSLRNVLFTEGSQVSYGTTRVLLGSLIVCFVFAWLEWRHGAGDNKRALSLLAAVYVASFMLLLFSWVGHDQTGGTSDQYKRLLLGQTVLGLLGMLLTWIVAFGWMADPNSLSLHLFYKSRLVRAYLGASNLLRGKSLKEVTEAVEKDDLPLHTLRNCERGAPFHLINTTLNLVGGRDLATAQRSSAYFTLSQAFCGSTRTGYRPTRDYMSGRMTLGTAVAVSGAAASPNMGAMTLTSSLAMLMTLLNVRLGFWAPTPNKNDWREPSARLWPFYVLREFLSQTNDLSAYCYLTDGGHFDNTGLYSLVERGCRYIVVADCGADPRPCFQDLGTAIRRCRIDFNAEISLDISQLERAKEKGSLPEGFVVVGKIKYDEDHLRSFLPKDWRDTPEGKELIRKQGREWLEEHRGKLVEKKGEEWFEKNRESLVERNGEKWIEDQGKGWIEKQSEKWIEEQNKRNDRWLAEHRNGRIVVFKPALTNVKKETPDVRQYGLENDGFPQQATIDLWYDEAQFESYRRLGQSAAEKFFNNNRRVRAREGTEIYNLEKLFDEIVKPG